MVTLTKHAIPGPDLNCAVPLALRELPACNVFLPNTSEDQKSPTTWGRGPATVPYGKSSAGYFITSIKILDEGLRWQLLGQKIWFYPGYTFKFVGRNWNKEVHRAPSRQYYLLLITVVKKLKMKKQDFFVKFVSLVAFRLRWPGLLGPHPWLRLWF